GDTDSIFLGNPTEEQLKELINWSKSTLKMELEVDKWYRYVALSSRKKNYLGVYRDGTVDIKGLTGKKRHIPEFLKRAFYEMIQILSKVKTKEEFNEAKEKIKKIVRDCYFNLKNHKYSLEDLAFRIVISKPPKGYIKTTPQHVKAAQLLESRGIEVKPGDLISFVKVVGDFGVKPTNLASIEEVDTRKYIEYIESTFEQVLDALGTNLSELIGHTKLEAFFEG
ncbi:MAG: DNA polymerase domain-containing protein, partial [Candidatus Bathyarchaeia archaeon]